ncbi:MAG: hypothetical protein JWM16_2795 [Verrucomicrobiales bacterium]|nr:hypothetical protein [Verrucomicrobiales bacterium]
MKLLCSLLVWLTAALLGRAAVYEEDFSSNPSAHGWRTFGNTNLFRWNATNANLEVTWDSSQSNSYFYFPLRTVLAKSDDFSFSFDLRLKDIQFGSDPSKPVTFQISAGLIHYRSATNNAHYRGAGTSSYGMRNFVEWDFFPDDGYGATWATTVVSTNVHFALAHNASLELTTGDLYRITLTYTTNDHTLRTTAMRNGFPFGLPPNNSLQNVILTSLPDFRVDAFAITSYGDAVQVGPREEWGSILAHGVVDNISLTVPSPALGNVALKSTNGMPRLEFASKTNWLYALERSTDFVSWEIAYPMTNGNGAILSLPDAADSAAGAFYRVRAERP